MYTVTKVLWFTSLG